MKEKNGGKKKCCQLSLFKMCILENIKYHKYAFIYTVLKMYTIGIMQCTVPCIRYLSISIYIALPHAFYC